jgi:hypothetical protein
LRTGFVAGGVVLRRSRGGGGRCVLFRTRGRLTSL